MAEQAKAGVRTCSRDELEQGVKLQAGGAVVLQIGAADAHVHALVAKLQGLGDVPLAHQRAQVIDPDTGEEVGAPVESDEEGTVRAEVPEDKPYRLELLDEGPGAVDGVHQSEGDDVAAVLLCRFIDAAEQPQAGLKLTATAGEDSFELETDEEGRIDSPAHLGPYTLKLGDEEFEAHAVLEKDREAEGSVYTFTVGGAAAQDDAGPEAVTDGGAEEHDDSEVHALVVTLRDPGGEPLANRKARLLDPDTGEAVGEPVESDEQGVVRAEAPEDKTYRLELLEDDALDLSPATAQQGDGDDEPALLLCRFVDGAGQPLAGRPVAASAGEDRFELTTDEAGRIESPAHLGPYTLELDGETFEAHAVLQKDRERGGVYTFVIGSSAQQDDGDDRGSSSAVTDHGPTTWDADDAAEQA